MTSNIGTDEMLYRLGRALNHGDLDQWGFNFARSVLGQAKRKGPMWRPSPKQASAILTLIGQPKSIESSESSALIDEDDTGWEGAA
ncbi:MAG: hypothetical protein AAGK00_18230 [Pseudomonadota bacterium]